MHTFGSIEPIFVTESTATAVKIPFVRVAVGYRAPVSKCRHSGSASIRPSASENYTTTWCPVRVFMLEMSGRLHVHRPDPRFRYSKIAHLHTCTLTFGECTRPCTSFEHNTKLHFKYELGICIGPPCVWKCKANSTSRVRIIQL